MQDIPLPPLSRAAFIGFPNYFFNLFVFRDEHTVNITRVAQHRLIFNRSEAHMTPESAKLNDHKFLV